MRRSGKSGMEPGTPIYVGENRSDRVQIDVMRFDGETFCELQDIAIDSLSAQVGGSGVLWVNVTGVHDVEILRRIGEFFDIHPLTVEDIANTDQRPKFEDYPGYIFGSVRREWI